MGQVADLVAKVRNKFHFWYIDTGQKYWLNWSSSYARLGLRHKLKGSTGGKEVIPNTDPVQTGDIDPDSLGANEARIIRNPDGSIQRIEYGDDLRHETIGESVADRATRHHSNGEDTDLVKALRLQTTMGAKKERLQSDRETDWVERLIEKHGDDYKAMFWDKELNVRQQSIGDIKKRVQKWKSKQ